MSPQMRIARLIARRAKIENDAVREQLRLLKQLRRDVLAELSDSVAFRAWRLEQALRVIDAEIRRLLPKAVASASDAARTVFRAGADVVLAVVPRLDHGLYGSSAELLRAVVDVTTDQLRSVWSELGTRLKVQVRRVTLGVIDPFEGIQNVARAIRDPKTFGTAFARAEMILRTEVNRGFSLATQARMEDASTALDKVGAGIRKYWLTAGDHRVRDAHRAAGRDYAKVNAIQIDKPYLVDGEELMQPLDPAGSAENTIGCRCVSVPVVIPATV